MNHRFIKTSVIATISLVLLYYSVAWAVLRCPHQENHSDQEAALYDSSSHAADISISFEEHQANIDCTGPKYHTEWLVGSSGPSEILCLTGDFGPYVDAFPAFPRVVRGQLADVWLRALFDKGSSSTIQIHLLRYLSLSVLRFQIHKQHFVACFSSAALR